MKQLILVAYIFFIVSGLSAQKVTIDECVASAIKNNPISSNIDLIKKDIDMEQKILKSGLLPRSSLNAQGTFQSDVISFDLGLDIPGLDLPEIPHFQYKATFDVSQVIYDGGITSRKDELNELIKLVRIEELVVHQDRIRTTVESVFLRILHLSEQIPVIGIQIASMESVESEMKSLLKEGVLLPSDLHKFEAILLQNRQQKESLLIAQKNLIYQLSALSGIQILFAGDLEIPNPSEPNELVSRSELRLMELQQNQMAASKNLLNCTRMPVVGAFGQFGYGRPGLNYMSENASEFFIGGIKASWQIWDWKKSNRQKEQLDFKSQMIENQKDAFVEDVQIKTIAVKSVIEQIESKLRTDEELIKLYDQIAETSKIQLSEGVIRMSDFLEAQNQAKISKQNRATHKIQLIQAKQNLLTLIGD